MRRATLDASESKFRFASSSAPQQVLADVTESPNGQTGGSEVMAMPLPASVWMLMAAIAGLGFLGYRRGAAS